MRTSGEIGRRIVAALAAGVLALAVNFAVLLSADALGIVTARGGFQRLVKLWLGPAFVAAGVDRSWSAMALPDPGGSLFMVLFKVGVGLGMALAYVPFEARLPGTPAAKGLLYALLVWLLNAALVLPLLGEGFAGGRSLTPLGIGAFALAHTAFFLVLALAYQRLANRPSRRFASVR